MPKYDQNFLTDAKTADKIIEAISLLDFEYLVEIGPGRGFLTRRLIDKFGRNFTAIEIDKNLTDYLKKTISPRNMPAIINADFLKLDLKKTLPAEKICFVGNLPYSVASAILQKVFKCDHFACAVFMFQKEVADRITANTPDKGYGVLTLSVQVKAATRQICKVKKNCFKPAPKVDSAVVAFEKLKKPVFDNPQAEEIFMKTVKASFAHRRKTISNSLCKSLGLPKKETEKILEKSQIPPKLRPQNLSLEQYKKLSEIIGGGNE